MNSSTLPLSAMPLPLETALPSLTEAKLREYFPAMMRFAKRKVRDESLAEEAVQEAMMAAWQNASRFAGQSSLKTWMLGILNHKIQDVFRKESRYLSMSAVDDAGEESGDANEWMDRLQTAVGWQMGRDQESEDPLHSLVRSDMHHALIKEIERLPSNLKEVFERQVLDDESTDEVCASLGITQANAWVRLHRARKQLSGRMQAHF